MLSEQMKAELYNKLVTRRREILEQTSRLKDQWRDRNFSEIEFADKAQQENAFQYLEELGDQARREVRVIDRALDRMQAGDYGACESCGNEISVRRLQALPWAALCRQCVQDREEGELPDEEAESAEDRKLTFFEPETPRDIEGMSDEELLEIIHERVHDDGRIETSELEISCEEGVVHLEGTLPDELQYNILLGILQDSLHLEDIVDNLRIDTLFRMTGPDSDERDFEKTDSIDDDLLWQGDDSEDGPF
jgi:DnaK suppressor protein